MTMAVSDAWMVHGMSRLRIGLFGVGKNPRWIEGLTVGVRCIEHDFLVVRVMNDNTMKE